MNPPSVVIASIMTGQAGASGFTPINSHNVAARQNDLSAAQTQQPPMSSETMARFVGTRAWMTSTEQQSSDRASIANPQPHLSSGSHEASVGPSPWSNASKELSSTPVPSVSTLSGSSSQTHFASSREIHRVVRGNGSSLSGDTHVQTLGVQQGAPNSQVGDRGDNSAATQEAQGSQRGRHDSRPVAQSVSALSARPDQFPGLPTRICEFRGPNTALQNDHGYLLSPASSVSPSVASTVLSPPGDTLIPDVNHSGIPNEEEIRRLIQLAVKHGGLDELERMLQEWAE